MVFADDSEEDTVIESPSELPQSLLPVIIDDPDIIEADRNLRQISVMLASISSPSGNETAADIYSLLYNLIYNDSSGFQYLRVYDHEMVVKFNTYLSMFTDQNGNINNPFYSNLVSGSTLSLADTALVVATHLQNLMRMSSNDGVDSNFVLAIQDIQSKLANTYTLVGLIHGQLSDQYGMSISNRLANTYQLLFDMHGSDFYYMNNHLTNIENSTSHIDSDLHEIKQWLNDTFYYEVDESTITELNYFQYNGWYGLYPFKTQFIIGYNNNANVNWTINDVNNNYLACFLKGGCVYEVHYPLLEGFTYSVNEPLQNILAERVSTSFNVKSTQNILNFDRNIIVNYYLDNNEFIIVYDLTNKNSDNYYAYSFISSKILQINNNGNINTDILLPYVPYSKIVYKSYIEHIDSDIHYQNDILDTFKELYASDDLIQAKQAQQDYEDQAISSFTGSGSAAVSTNDLGSIENISSGVSSGLNTNVPSSEVMQVFTPSSDFYSGWFSQANKNEINNIYSVNNNRNGLRSAPSGSEPEVIDFLTQNKEDLYDHIGNYYD